MDEEDKRFDAVLIRVGDRKINVAKLVREAVGLELPEARDLIESVPQTLRKDMRRDAAEMLLHRFEAVGATVDLRPSPRT
jgi:large subunit ribosomal protein L7/L12